MATIVFYEKPGCRNNTRQKALLQASGTTGNPVCEIFAAHPFASWTSAAREAWQFATPVILNEVKDLVAPKRSLAPLGMTTHFFC